MKKTGALLLSIFVFIASINIIVNQHFCNDELESIAIFINAQPCEHATDKNNLPPCHQKSISNKKECCSENSVIVKSTDWLKIISNQVNLDKISLEVATIEQSINNPDLFELKEYSPEKVPKPPDEFDEIFIVHQAFLL